MKTKFYLLIVLLFTPGVFISKLFIAIFIFLLFELYIEYNNIYNISIWLCITYIILLMRYDGVLIN